MDKRVFVNRKRTPSTGRQLVVMLGGVAVITLLLVAAISAMAAPAPASTPDDTVALTTHEVDRADIELLAQSSDCARFVTDVNFPDGSSVRTGQSIDKVWRLQNCGSAWSGVQAVRVGGNYGPASFGVPQAGANQTVEVHAGITAPNNAGQHQRATYQLRGPRGNFGPTFWVELNVTDPHPQPVTGAPQPVALVPGVQPTTTESCFVYVWRRRVGHIPYVGGNAGAYNLIYEGNNANTRRIKPVTVFSGSADLRTVVATGWAIVWDRTSAYPVDRTYGHIAVIESVSRDSVTISQANVFNRNHQLVSRVTLTRSDLIKAGTYFFGADANHLVQLH